MERRLTSSVKFVGFLFTILAGCILFVMAFHQFLNWSDARHAAVVKYRQAQLEMKWMAEAPVSEYERFDPWGTKYRMESEDSPEMVVRTQIVTSAGPDQLFGTNDDMQVLERDLNWTHAGEAAGARAGRAARGFVKGLGKSNDGN